VSAFEQVRAPEEDQAAERTWAVVEAAFAERVQAPRRRRRLVRPALALAVVAALGAVALTPPGRAVVTSVRRAIGIVPVQRALFSLPARGNVLAGAWVVHADGSTRRLGDYREASWSPFGRFVVAARADGLAALEPNGEVRWTLARPDVRFPRWGGGLTDTRIAYLSGSTLRIVAGDGTGDRAIGPAAAVAPAWREAASARALVLAYADPRGRIRVLAPATGRTLFRTQPGPAPTLLAWSDDGSRLLVLDPTRLRLFDVSGRLVASVRGSFVDAAFLPRSRRVALIRTDDGVSVVSLLGARRPLFPSAGRLAQVVPSPDGRWLLLTWPDANEWLFVPIRGAARVRAVGNIAEQLGGPARVEGWR